MMLTGDEKQILRVLFQNKLLKSDGQSFEDIFRDIMYYSEPEFRQIKPWGNIGDRKNDGYIKSKGIFFQVYAPEDISYPNVIRKLEEDFAGLLAQWSPVNEFYFVVNDKYKGVNPDSEQCLERIRTDNNLRKAEIKTAKDLENLLFSLDDDEITMIVGKIPDPANIKLDYSILNEVIGYIMDMPLPEGMPQKIALPDWDDKIKFNCLSPYVNHLLNNGSMQIFYLEEYLANNSDFLSDNLRDRMNEIYLEKKKHSKGNILFWEIVNEASPRSEQKYQSAVIVIMSKYFETCDIFEMPQKDDI